MSDEQSVYGYLSFKEAIKVQKNLSKSIVGSIQKAKRLRTVLRTKKFYLRRLQYLQADWNEFESNYVRLRVQMIEGQDNEFNNNEELFETTESKYIETFNYVMKRLRELESPDDHPESTQTPYHSVTVPSDGTRATVPTESLSQDEDPLCDANSSTIRAEIKREYVEVDEERLEKTQNGSTNGGTPGRETKMVFCYDTEKAMELNDKQIERLRQSLEKIQRWKMNAKGNLTLAMEQENRYIEQQVAECVAVREERECDSDRVYWLVEPKELNVLQIQALHQCLEAMEEEEANVKQNLASALEQKERYEQQKAEYIAHQANRTLNLRNSASLVLRPEL